MTCPTQQTLHLARPVFLLDFNQRLKFAQVVRIAQRVQNALQGVVRLPVIVDDNTQDVFQQAAPFRGDAVKRQPDGRGDVQPLRLAADPEAGFVHVFHGRRRHLVAHRGREALKPHGTAPAHAGDRRGDQMHAEQIGHQRGQTLLGQQLIVQQIHHHRGEARTVLHRRGHVFGKGGPCLGATLPAKAGMGAVFRDNQRLGFGKIEHLTRGMAGGHPLVQGRAATGTSLGKMINRGIRVLGSAQGLAGMTLLPTRLLA